MQVHAMVPAEERSPSQKTAKTAALPGQGRLPRLSILISHQHGLTLCEKSFVPRLWKADAQQQRHPTATAWLSWARMACNDLAMSLKTLKFWQGNESSVL